MLMVTEVDALNGMEAQMIWGCTLLLSSPMLAFCTMQEYNSEGHNVTACIIIYPSSSWEVFTNILLNSVGFLLPLSVITFCTVQIMQVLRNNEMQKFKEIQTERKATLLVLAVLLLFVVCWLPFQISTFLDTLLHLQVLSGCWYRKIDIFTQISSFVAYSNSCLNPLVYVIVGKRFRKKSREVYARLCRPCGCGSAEPSQTENSMGTLRTSISVERHIHKLQ